MFLRLAWVWLLCISAFAIAADSELPDIKDVRKVMHELFSYHVEYKEISSKLYKRAIRHSIEQFDPYRIYLTEKEAGRFLNLSDEEAEANVRGYYKDEYPLATELFTHFSSAIERHHKILNSLTFSRLESVSRLSPYSPKSERELKERVRQYYLLLMAKEAEKAGVSEHKMPLLMKYVFQKQAEHEEKYALEMQHLILIKSFAKSLDAHTGYYSHTEIDEMRKRLQKQFCGTGLIFKETYLGITVSGVLPGSPAHRNGEVQIGDTLIYVNGCEIEGRSFASIMSEVKGKAGTNVQFGFTRGEQLFSVELARETIVVDDARVKVKTMPLSDGIIAVVTLPAFYDNGDGISAVADFKAAIREARSQGDLKGVVVDMRDNAGGFLSQAIKFSGLFIAKGIVVVSRYSDGEIKYSRDLDGRQFYDGPMVVLTSKASASCAEIVAQALQDYGVALVVGDERTYGKGTMQYQTITDKYAKIYYKVTVGRYYTASGRSTQLEGVKADIVVPTTYAPYNIGEKYLQYPISADYLTGEQIDTLHLLHAGNFQKEISSPIPCLMAQETQWRKMVPTLVENSKKRLGSNKNYQAFLQYIQNKSPYKRTENAPKYNFGANDLQLEESIQIVTDMVRLSNTVAHVE